MRQVDFYALPRAVQDRFVESARGTGVPAPLAVKLPRLEETVWLLLAGVAALGLIGFAAIGFGDLTSSMGLHGPGLLVVYSLFGGVLAFALLRVFVQRRRLIKSPYNRALFLFPVGVVDAVTSDIGVHPVSELERVEVPAGSAKVRLFFSGRARFDFETKGAERAKEVGRAIEEAKVQLAHAEETHNRRELAVLDPLQDNGFSNPFSPKTPFVRPRYLSNAMLLVLGLIAGTALAFPVWLVRNVGSERRLIVAAHVQDTPAAYRTLLARGAESPEVVSALLPRAELREAEKRGDATAIRGLLEQKPAKDVEQEALAALRRVLLVKLEEAKKKQSLKALAAFENENPRHDLVATEIAQARHALFQRGLSSFLAQAQPKEEVQNLFQRLLAHSEKHGPKVVVRFANKPTDHEMIESAIRRSDYYRGNVSLPSQYFDAENAEKRQAEIGEKLVSRLNKAFSPEILKFELGPAIRGAEEALPKPEVPTLFIERSVRLSGGYMSRVPRGIFVGIGMLLEVTFAIPGDEEPYRFKFSAWRPPDFDYLRKNSPETPELYHHMAMSAYEQFLTKFLAEVFTSP